ncbi:hypothetical protein P5V15_012750 [Pogonomyrmex californicus]
MQELRFVPDNIASQAKLADGSSMEISGTVKLPVRIEGQTIEHHFHILPELESEMLIGVDLWGKSNIKLVPPQFDKGKDITLARISAARQHDETESIKLHHFLKNEMRKFKEVRGPTELLRPYPPEKRYASNQAKIPAA